MFTFVRLTVENWVTFKKATLKLDNGLTIIRGYNKDTIKKGNASRISNGSGKSLLISAITNIFFDTFPVVTTKRAERHIAKAKLTLTGKLNDTHYKIVKSFEKGKPHYTVFKDKVDLKIRGIKEQLAYVQGLLNLSETEWYTFVHLDSRRSANFQLGSGADRKLFWENVFTLDNLNEIKESLRTEYNALNKKKEEYEFTKAEFKSIEVPDVEELDRQIQECKYERHEAAQSIELIQRDLNTWTAYENQKDIAKRIKKIAIKYSIDKEQVPEELKRLKLQLQAYDSYKVANKLYNGWQLDKEDAFKELKLVIKESKLTKEQYASISPIISEVVEELKELEKLRRAVPKEPTFMEAVLDPTPFIATTKSEISRLTQVLNVLKESTSHNCPVCETELRGKKVDQLSTKFEKDIESLQKQLKKYRADMELFEEYSEYETKVKSYNKAFYAYNIASGKVKVPELTLSLATKLEDAIMEYSYVNRKKMEKPEVVEDCSEQYEDLKELKRLLELYVEITPPNKSVEALQKKKIKLHEILSNSNAISNLSGKYALAVESKNKKIQLRGKLKSLKKDLYYYDHFQILWKAFSGKGVKILILQHLSKLVEERFNKFSPYFFREKFTFSFDVTETSFSVMVYRPSKQSSDVRYLCGAESRAFNLLLFYSLYTLLPVRKRTNLLLLDEPAVNFDIQGREHFCSQVVPFLLNTITNIVIATPQNTEEEPYEESTNLLVIKESGESKLTEEVSG